MATPSCVAEAYYIVAGTSRAVPAAEAEIVRSAATMLASWAEDSPERPLVVEPVEELTTEGP